MKVASLNVGMPREVQVQGRSIQTGIFKQPTSEELMVRRHNIDGDGQADLKVHGGEFKAVYSYAGEFYPLWESELQRALQPGMFGENLTTEGLDETRINVGDILSAGNARLQAVQPRMPCFKLGVRFDDPGIIKRFVQSERWGLYFRVVEEGTVAPGSSITIVERHPEAIPVYEILRLFYKKVWGPTASRLATVECLPPNWREHFASPPA